MKHCREDKKELRRISQILGGLKKNTLAHVRTRLQSPVSTTTAVAATAEVFYSQDHFLGVYFFGYFKKCMLNIADSEAACITPYPEPRGVAESSSITYYIHLSTIQYFEQENDPNNNDGIKVSASIQYKEGSNIECSDATS
jgi:hypothetical protein